MLLTECIKHDLDLVYGKVFISVFHGCNLLKIVHSVPILGKATPMYIWPCVLGCKILL